ncbi:MAG: glycosyltransferase family 2 protein [Solirubrobacterales bacterium]
MAADSAQIPEILEQPRHPLADWFDDHRAERQQARDRAIADGTLNRSRAIITMVYNEAFFLPIWLRYYSRFFDPADIYVLDNQSVDGSTNGGDYNREIVEHNSVDHTWMVETIEKKQRELLEGGYDLVLVTDVDELVVPDPSLGDLGTYMDTMVEEFVTCMGYELIHLPDREGPLDPKRPVTEQRGYWTENAAYNKSAMATRPSSWEPGFHRRKDKHFRGDPDLFMVHLHRADYDVCLDRHLLRKDRAWEVEDEQSGWAAHNRITEKEEFDRWFFTDTGFEGFPLRVERIPERWKGTF